MITLIIPILMSCSTAATGFSIDKVDAEGKSFQLTENSYLGSRAIGDGNLNVFMNIKNVNSPTRKALIETGIRKHINPASIVFEEQERLLKLLKNKDLSSIEIDGETYNVTKIQNSASSISWKIPDFDGRTMTINRVSEDEFTLAISMEDVNFANLHEGNTEVKASFDGGLGWIFKLVPENQKDVDSNKFKQLIRNEASLTQFTNYGESLFNVFRYDGTKTLEQGSANAVDKTVKKILPKLLSKVSLAITQAETDLAAHPEQLQYFEDNNFNIDIGDLDLSTVTGLENTTIFDETTLTFQLEVRDTSVSFRDDLGNINISILFVDDSKAKVYYSLSTSYEGVTSKNIQVNEFYNRVTHEISEISSFVITHQNDHIQSTSISPDHSGNSILLIEGEFDMTSSQ
ncbi:MAG TPA: hypothetical protein DEP20_00705 [Fusobacteria bacterium]|nr:hypothetical protein [Fusobacteriota bacterium]